MQAATTAAFTDLPKPLLDHIVREAFELAGSDLRAWLQLVLVYKHARFAASHQHIVACRIMLSRPTWCSTHLKQLHLLMATEQLLTCSLRGLPACCGAAHTS